MYIFIHTNFQQLVAISISYNKRFHHLHFSPALGAAKARHHIAIIRMHVRLLDLWQERRPRGEERLLRADRQTMLYGSRRERCLKMEKKKKKTWPANRITNEYLIRLFTIVYTQSEDFSLVALRMNSKGEITDWVYHSHPFSSMSHGVEKRKEKKGGGKMEQLTKLPLQDVFIWACRVQKFSSLSRSMSYGLRQGRDFPLLFQICEPLCFFYVDWIDRGKEESSFTGFRVFHFFLFILSLLSIYFLRV